MAIILGALVAIVVGIAAFIGCVVFSAVANRRVWKDNLEAYVKGGDAK